MKPRRFRSNEEDVNNGTRDLECTVRRQPLIKAKVRLPEIILYYHRFFLYTVDQEIPDNPLS
jgi:hypothetical protein